MAHGSRARGPGGAGRPPVVDLDSGAVVGDEALVAGPVGPLQRPDALFAAARSAGRLAELDGLCRRAASTGAVEQGLLAPLTLFVNVEPEVLDTAPLDDLLGIAGARDDVAAVDLGLEQVVWRVVRRNSEPSGTEPSVGPAAVHAVFDGLCAGIAGVLAGLLRPAAGLVGGASQE